MEFTLLGPRTHGLMLSVQGPADSVPVVIPWGRGPVDSALAAESAFDAPGAWVVRVTAADGTVPLQATVQVAPAAPGAWSRWPWLLAWVPMVALLALRDSATTYTAHRTRA